MPTFLPLTPECAPHSLWTPRGHSFSISTSCWLLPGHSPSGEAVQRGFGHSSTSNGPIWELLHVLVTRRSRSRQQKNPINFEIGKRKILAFWLCLFVEKLTAKISKGSVVSQVKELIIELFLNIRKWKLPMINFYVSYRPHLGGNTHQIHKYLQGAFLLTLFEDYAPWRGE